MMAGRVLPLLVAMAGLPAPLTSTARRRRRLAAVCGSLVDAVGHRLIARAIGSPGSLSLRSWHAVGLCLSGCFQSLAEMSYTDREMYNIKSIIRIQSRQAGQSGPAGRGRQAASRDHHPDPLSSGGIGQSAPGMRPGQGQGRRGQHELPRPRSPSRAACKRAWALGCVPAWALGGRTFYLLRQTTPGG